MQKPPFQSSNVRGQKTYRHSQGEDTKPSKHIPNPLSIASCRSSQVILHKLGQTASVSLFLKSSGYLTRARSHPSSFSNNSDVAEPNVQKKIARRGREVGGLPPWVCTTACDPQSLRRAIRSLSTFPWPVQRWPARRCMSGTKVICLEYDGHVVSNHQRHICQDRFGEGK